VIDKILYKNALTYVIGNVSLQSIPFLLLPILTHYLTPEEYAIITTFNIVVGILMIILGFNSVGFISVEFFKCTQIQINIYKNTYTVLLVVSTLIILIIANIVQFIFPLQLLLPFKWINIAIIVSFFNLIIGLKLLLLQFEKKAISYVIIQLAVMLINMVGTVILITIFNMNYEGRLLSAIIASTVMGILTCILLFDKSTLFSYDRTKIKSLLAFGIPLIPHKASKWARGGLDKILLLILVGAHSTGIYSVGYTLSLAMWVLVSSIDKAYTPYLFEKLNNERSVDKFKVVKLTYKYFIILFIIWLIMNFFLNYTLVYIIGKEYLECKKYIIWLSLGFVFHGMYLAITNFIIFTKKTYILSIISVFSTVIYLLLAYLLIKIYGTIGAAIATPIAYFITFILSFYYANKVFPMPWNLTILSNDT